MESRLALIEKYTQKLKYLYNIKGEVNVIEFELREIERELYSMDNGQTPRCW